MDAIFLLPIIQLSVVFIFTGIVAFLLKLLKQPLIPAYILAGILLGPVFQLIKDAEFISLLSELGIAFLLFFAGLEFSFEKIKKISVPAIIIGFLQVSASFILGFYLAGWLNFGFLPAVYIGLILAFSSTLIAVKIFSDRRELDTLHGRISIAILLLQDLFAVWALAILPEAQNPWAMGYPLLATFALIFIIVFASKYSLPPVFRYAAQFPELLFLTAMSVCFAYIFAAEVLGLSIAIGAFVAGMGLAQLPYSREISGLIRPLRDFFIVLFFVFLGMQLAPFNPGLLWVFFLFLFISIFIKPFIIFFFSSILGYEARTGFFSGISLGQLSEFSLILATQAFLSGIFSQEFFSFIVLLTVTSMLVSTYAIHHKSGVYGKLSRILRPFEKLAIKKVKYSYQARSEKKIVIFGCHRMGSIFLNRLKKSLRSIIVVDHNPEVIESLMKEKVSCIYGDMENPEILESLDLSQIKLIISTVPDDDANAFLIRYVKARNPEIKIFVTSDHLKQVPKLYELGADYVILPHFLSGESVARIIRAVLSGKKELSDIRYRHVEHLKKIKVYG